MAPKPSMKTIMSRKKALRVTASIQLDGEIVTKIEALRARYRAEEKKDSQENRNPKAPAIAREIEALIEAAKKSEVEFVFRSIGRASFDELINLHTPTKEDEKQGANWNLETFPPALISLASEDPRITPEEATAIWESEDWSGAEVLKLFGGALEANSEVPDIPFDRIATELTRNIARSLTSAPTEESPAPFS